MFMIQALVYVFIVGSVAEAPIPVQHKLSFNGLDKCQEYLKSDEFQAQRQQLAFFFKMRATMPAHDAEDADDAPEPAVTITASCIEDNRL